jgi:hypothetical protein
MLEFVKHQILAIIALCQPWVAWLWKKYLTKGYVENYPAGSLEIGYSEFGPTLAIQGTLRARGKDVFVKRMRLRIRKLRNNEEYSFDWVAFRPS